MKTEVSRKERTLASIPLDLKRQANEGSDVCVCVCGGGVVGLCGAGGWLGGESR